MSKGIEDLVSSCAVCKTYQPDQQREREREPMISHEIPTWEKVGCDLFDFESKHFLVFVDY